MADLPQEADEQHENPVRPESHPHMADGENQMRELRICPYEYFQSLWQAIPPLYETTGYKSCPGCGKITTRELEAVVVKKLASYKTLTGISALVRLLPCVVSCKLYFFKRKITNFI